MADSKGLVLALSSMMFAGTNDIVFRQVSTPDDDCPSGLWMASHSFSASLNAPHRCLRTADCVYLLHCLSVALSALQYGNKDGAVIGYYISVAGWFWAVMQIASCLIHRERTAPGSGTCNMSNGRQQACLALTLLAVTHSDPLVVQYCRSHTLLFPTHSLTHCFSLPGLGFTHSAV